MREILGTSGTAFAIALILTPIIRDIFHAYNVVDRPGFRKIHAHPIPRLGGLAIAAAYAIALALTPAGIGPGFDLEALLSKILPGAAAILPIGILDDFFNLRPVYKLGGQVAAAAIAFASGLRIDAIGDISLPLAASLPLTVFWLLVAMNALNLIDGLDGLCAGMGWVGASALYAVGWERDNVPLQQTALPLAGALLGFLCYNFSRATMFLGDSGALLIGFLIGCGGILSLAGGTRWTAAVPLMVIAIPLLDLSLSVVRRFLAKRPIFSADRGHIHHRLLDRGLSPRRAVLTLYAWALAGALFAVAAARPSLQRWRPFAIVGFCFLAWLGIRKLRYSELTVAAKFFFATELWGVARPVKGDETVRKLAAALRQAASEDQWWELLVAAGREAGWTDVLWICDHAVRREHVFPGHTQPVWSFNLTLSESESLQIHGTLGPLPPALEIPGFAEAVQSAFAARRQAWDRPAHS